MNSKYKRGVAVVLLSVLILLPLQGSAQSSVNVNVHYIEGQVSPDGVSHDVSVVLSVLDGDGRPVDALSRTDFNVVEDSRQVEILSLAPALNEPINVILLLDTSGSMARGKIISAREAAADFVAGLSPKDQVAILTFNQEINTLVDFSNDFEDIQTRLQSVTEVLNAGTCLYDAAYQAAEMASTLPTGRRALILLTDGIDMTYEGETCSTYTLDDVIDFAIGAATRVPVYTIGLGDEVDLSGLKRLATTSGGQFLYAPTPAELQSLYAQLLDQLNSQYVLRYNSNGAPGVHSLTIEVDSRGTMDQDTRQFVLPVLPTKIKILSPVIGQEFLQTIKIQASVISQGENIFQIVFEINGQGVGAARQPPYEIEWDISALDYGEMSISAIAQNENFEEIARDSVTVTHLAPPTDTPEISPEDTPVILDLASAEISDSTVQSESAEYEINLLTIFWVAGPTLLIILVGIYFSSRKSKSHPEGYAFDGTLEIPPLSSDSNSDATVDDLMVGAGGFNYGSLTVIYSDDPSMIGQIFLITKTKITLGRSADNDFMFPKDNPVSRYHAVIEVQTNRLVIYEVQTFDASGKAKTPRYGTYVKSGNLVERMISSNPEVLKTGDEIRLGNRTKIIFKAETERFVEPDVTIDELSINNGDDDYKTIEVKMD